jgi:hypothetical protein
MQNSSVAGEFEPVTPNDGRGKTDSAVIPIGERDVASTVTASVDATRASTTTATSSITCSQLSRISNPRRVEKTSTSRSRIEWIRVT